MIEDRYTSARVGAADGGRVARGLTVASRGRERRIGAAAIVARIPWAQAAEEITAELESRMDAFEHLSAASHADVVSGWKRTLRRWSLFVSTGVMPADGDLPRRARAAGVRGGAPDTQSARSAVRRVAAGWR
ncbi:MAG TPA: hypothetical protein VK272_08670 [Solirubrobacteraceae bacterium]|nr:hypothetical protein [Solirubrobacteraceae bacterium]